MSTDTMSTDTMSTDTMRNHKRRMMELDRLIHSAIDSDDIEQLAEAIGYDTDMLYQRVEQLLPNLKPAIAYAIQLPIYPIVNHSALNDEWTFKYIEPAQDIPLSNAEWNSIKFDGPSAAMVKRASRIKQESQSAKVNGGAREKPIVIKQYRTIVRKYLRTIRNSIAGEPITRTAYVKVVIDDIENAEPDDFTFSFYSANKIERQESLNHVRANSKYTRA
jgi:hypothetical protein